MYRDQEISVILVDDADMQLGYGDKLEVHRKGILHRSFSIFIFDDQNRLLMQRRSNSKYHAKSLWCNTCCGHPSPGEATEEAAHRRLYEEMGLCAEFDIIDPIHYRQEFDEGYIEHEYVHLFRGKYNHEPIHPHPNEVSEFSWNLPENVRSDCQENPEKYARWFSYFIMNHYDLIFNNLH